MNTALTTKFTKAWTALAVIWAVGSLALLLSSLFSSFNPGFLPEVYWLAVSILTPVTFLMFGWDKWKAKRDSQRIPEKTLYLLSILGGWPGAVMGQKTFRHKTVKRSFRTVLTVIVLLHVGIGLLLVLQPLFATEVNA